jgi:hypothetical protein
MAMMGPAVDRQDRLFYEFNLEERIPDDHLDILSSGVRRQGVVEHRRGAGFSVIRSMGATFT